MNVESATLQTLKEIEIFSDTEGTYLFYLAEKLRVYEDGQTVNQSPQVFLSDIGS